MAGPTVAVAITKQQIWHGIQEQFDTVYYFDGPALQAGDANFERLVNALVVAEKKVFGKNVQFVTGRVWSAGGTAVQNVTKGLYTLSGVGAVEGQTTHGEAAVLVKIECERPNVLGRKVYLRKFLRVGQIFSAFQNNMAEGRQALDAQMIGFYRDYGETIRKVDIDPGVLFVLVSPTGRVPRLGTPATVSPFIISREYRRN
jgi:hypothetical protein